MIHADERFHEAPVLLNDLKTGLVIQQHPNEGTFWVQVPGEPNYRVIEMANLEETVGGIIREMGPPKERR